jgi:hypothetical protein
MHAVERNRRHSVDIRQGKAIGRDEDGEEFPRDRVMLITICRLYDSYNDANRVVLMLEAAGLPASETSVISNNSDTWYSAPHNAGVVPIRKEGASSKAEG